MYPAGNDNVHIYQELLRDELHDQLLWPLVCISETKYTTSLCASLPFILHYANLGQMGVTHRFSPWLTWTWQGRERVSFVLESMEEALGFCGDWWRQRERWQGEGKKERQNKMKRLTYRVKRLCWQRWMVGLEAGGLGEINNLCVQLPQQERSHW